MNPELKFHSVPVNGKIEWHANLCSMSCCNATLHGGDQLKNHSRTTDYFIPIHSAMQQLVPSHVLSAWLRQPSSGRFEAEM
jgi:hypothetical protein